MQYEYSLVCFTVFGQMAAGISMLIWLAGLDRFPEIEWVAWLVALATGVLAAIGATLHLSNPFAGVYSVTQIHQAWLSREIICGAVFGLLVVLRLREVIPARLNWLIGVVGLAFVLVMARVYRAEIMPFWNTAGTELSFVGSALVLGAATVAALMVFRRHEPDCRVSCAALLAGLAGLLCMVALPLFWLPQTPLVAAMPLFKTFATASLCMSLTAFVCVVAGGVCLRAREVLLWPGLLLVIGGVIVGRMLFYAAAVLKVGI